ncbi:DUF29 domain-containing protein [Methylobacterium sp. NEAU 140]|uniref:DUF29 domain-containing protein n=1 Tax=Methylobacterium sp. NEAU 140 TaxID=3064945 RepID=UPI0027355BE6|nr:DUF29 domain-containing protein [Methylobacterium sp. NEAU 140]MDP4021612.1 DUF29 domain-containing protein [Methylobacterium sp. NEAU 140]
MEEAMAHPAEVMEATDAPPAAPGRTRHEDDLYTWVQEQIALLRAGRVDALDLDNIAEELSDVGNAQYSQLESALRVLMIHMLKWDQQPEKRTPSWIYSIREQRRRYAKILRKNPGLKQHLETIREDIYPISRDWAADECNLQPDEFPPNCPYDWEDLLERPFDLDSVKK